MDRTKEGINDKREIEAKIDQGVSRTGLLRGPDKGKGRDAEKVGEALVRQAVGGSAEFIKVIVTVNMLIVNI